MSLLNDLKQASCAVLCYARFLLAILLTHNNVNNLLLLPKLRILVLGLTRGYLATMPNAESVWFNHQNQ